MLAYIGTNEILVVAVVLFWVLVVPIAVVAFLATRRRNSAADQAKQIADLREEVGRLREHILRSEGAVPPIVHEVNDGSRVRVGQR